MPLSDGYKHYHRFQFINVTSDAESSRPREPPPQSLTDTDMNLSIHPAPIDQPTVPQIASAQKDKASV